MAFWKSSTKFGLNYHLMKRPEDSPYFTDGPVSNGGEAAAEAMLSISVSLNHNSVLWALWDRGIVPIEQQIMSRFIKETPQAMAYETKYEMTHGNVLNIKNYGVLIEGVIFESAVVNQDVKSPQRAFECAYIATTGFSYDIAAREYSKRDKLYPAKKGWKLALYHVWAVRS